MVPVYDSSAVENISIGGSCGDGLYNCGGVCISTPCPENELETYIHLRTVLDALETHALRYLLEGDEATRKERAVEILRALQPALELVGAYAKAPSTST